MGVRRDGPEEAAVSDPLFRDGEPFFLGREDLERPGTADALVVTPMPPSKADTAFGFSWFTTKLFAERSLMRDIVVAALTMHLIGLSVPIFFQLLVDKVIPNQAFATLYAMSAGVGVLILFDAGFNYLRNYLLAFITRRLDHQVANEHDRPPAQLADRLFPRQPVRRHRLQARRKPTTSAISWRAGCSTPCSTFSP